MNSYKTNLNLVNVDIGLLIFRMAIAALMLTHGFPKLLKFFGPEEIVFADPLGLGETISFTLAVFAEFICSVFIIFGFLTRFSAIPIVITMAVAAFIVHAPDGFGKQELPILFMFGFLLLVICGGGKYSLDYLLQNKK
ncbi:putative oxidoreductase [Christiangramia gaetbulicola]|uniref:Putative oxidoreductase n=1 Tax=Christiangramia gaetbulicola TaxID=703340 RepID=A0A2T6AH30_9FLAO|nr:DoxX family protein [Christiangramia gaetbulicola]PTX43130.1 putative oxidoreductase [Christiangramia gaetbulicola]